MKNKNDVEVLINGRKYTICGFESAEYLQKVATYINSKYMEFKDKDYYYSLDMDLRNILLAVNIADDYFKAKKEAWIIQKDNERKDKMVLDMKHEVLDSQSGTAKVGQENEALKDDLEEAEKKIVELNVKNEDNMMKVSELEEKLSKAYEEGKHTFAFYDGQKWLTITLKDEALLDEILPHLSTASRRLDVTILHTLVLERLLGIDKENMASVDAGESNCCFLLNPTRVEEIGQVAAKGEKMPQKSTYFYPKLITGLVMNKFA